MWALVDMRDVHRPAIGCRGEVRTAAFELCGRQSFERIYQLHIQTVFVLLDNLDGRLIVLLCRLELIAPVLDNRKVRQRFGHFVGLRTLRANRYLDNALGNGVCFVQRSLFHEHLESGEFAEQQFFFIDLGHGRQRVFCEALFGNGDLGIFRRRRNSRFVLRQDGAGYENQQRAGQQWQVWLHLM